MRRLLACLITGMALASRRRYGVITGGAIL